MNTTKRLLGLGAVLSAYIGLPYLLVQLLGYGLVREGNWGQYTLALTFDDGPDPATTPQVLDALAAAGAKATFFVLTDKAATHPELLRRIADEGHEIELHATRHTHAWATLPHLAYAEAGRGKVALQRLGLNVKYHRPPHGAYTLATILGQRQAGLTGAHWNIEAHDWHPDYTPRKVTERVLRYSHPGAVVVMHDAGPGAKNTVPALPELLKRLQRRGYQLVRLDELPRAVPLGKATLGRRVSMLTDRLFDHLGKVTPIMGRMDAGFRMGLIKMPLSVTLKDGTVVPRGATVLDIHVNSPLMVDYGVKPGLRRARAWDLPLLAKELSERPDWKDIPYITTIGGFSFILGLMGFETHDIPEGMERRLSLWGLFLKWAYGAQTVAPQVKLSVIRTQDFIDRYQGKGKDVQDGGPFELDEG